MSLDRARITAAAALPAALATGAAGQDGAAADRAALEALYDATGDDWGGRRELEDAVAAR